MKKFTHNSSEGATTFIFMTSAPPASRAMRVLPTCGHELYYIGTGIKAFLFSSIHKEQDERDKQSSHNSSGADRKPRAMNLINSVI